MDFSDLIKTPKLNHVTLFRQLKPPICGTLCLTFSHIIVSSRSSESDNGSNDEEEIWVIVFTDNIHTLHLTPYLYLKPDTSPKHRYN